MLLVHVDESDNDSGVRCGSSIITTGNFSEQDSRPVSRSRLFLPDMMVSHHIPNLASKLAS